MNSATYIVRLAALTAVAITAAVATFRPISAADKEKLGGFVAADANDVVVPKQRWAVVASDNRAAGLADLLTAELSAWDGVELVERDQIRRVLDELKLNASRLVERDRAVRFGQLSHADALVLLDAAGQDAAGGLRLRLVETRTSIRLLDLSLPAQGLDREVAAISDALKASREKLAVSADRRQLIGVMPIKTEEPGGHLKPFCRTLTTLVEVELHRHPQLVVLERSQLRRLTAERDLTGIELKLRGATRLLEMGVRRADDGKGMIATCRVVSPGGGEPQIVKVAIPSREPVAVRDEIVAAVDRVLGDRVTARHRVAPDIEAAEFDRRRVWFHTAYLPEEAAEMAEAALALAPTSDRLSSAFLAYSSWSHIKDSRLNSHEALPAALRYQQLRLEWINKTTPADPMRRAINLRSPFSPHVRLPSEGESEEDRRIRTELDALSLQAFDLFLAGATNDAPRRLDLLLQRLAYSAYLAVTGRQFTETLPDLLDKILATMREAGVPADLQNATYVRFATLLVVVMEKAVHQTDRTRFGSDDRVWKAEEFAPLPAQLAEHDDPVIRAVGLFAQAHRQDEVGLQAAADLLSAVEPWPPVRYQGHHANERLKAIALLRLRGTKWEREFIDNLLGRAERERDPRQVLENRVTLVAVLGNAPRDQKAPLAERILGVLNLEHEANESRDANYWRSSLVARLRDIGTREVAEFSLENAPGPWQQYVARPIPLRCAAGDDRGLQSVFVDHRDDACQRGGELVLIWGRPDRKLSIERGSLAGGKPRKFGPDIPGSNKAFRGIQIAVGPDAIYVASNPDGFTVLREDSFEVFTEEQGAPSNDVWALAWWKDRLFIAFNDSFAVFDPQTKNFQLLASAVSVAQKNVLDGRGSFFIRSLLPDEANGCIWMSVQDNTLPRDRNGLWRYQPDTNTYQKIQGAFYANVSYADDGFFLHLEGQQPWAYFDRETAEVEMLTQYAAFRKSDNRALPYTRSVKVGRHIITDDRQLLTPDGQTHRLKLDVDVLWLMLQRAGPGFITHFDADTNILWYVEPKTAVETTVSDTPVAKGNSE